jgi:hypothetical protein
VVEFGIELGSAEEDDNLVSDDVDECDELARDNVTMTVRCNVDVFTTFEEDDTEVCMA